jgi:hypothetical protein
MLYKEICSMSVPMKAFTRFGRMASANNMSWMEDIWVQPLKPQDDVLGFLRVIYGLDRHKNFERCLFTLPPRREVPNTTGILYTSPPISRPISVGSSLPFSLSNALDGLQPRKDIPMMLGCNIERLTTF